MSIEIAQKYTETLTLREHEKEEVANLIVGYMTDCAAKDTEIDRLKDALDDIWSCANSGYSLGDLKKKIGLYTEGDDSLTTNA